MVAGSSCFIPKSESKDAFRSYSASYVTRDKVFFSRDLH